MAIAAANEKKPERKCDICGKRHCDICDRPIGYGKRCHWCEWLLDDEDE